MGIKDKFPQGQLFCDNPILDLFLKGFEISTSSIETFTTQNITDLDPRKTTNYINEWARLLEITSEVDAIPNIADKRAYIYGKLLNDAVKTPAYFINKILSGSGYTATIQEYNTAEAGECEAGESCQSEESGNNAGYTIVFEIATTDNNAELELFETGGECGEILTCNGIENVEVPVLLEFPLILNIVFRYNDGTKEFRNF